MREIKFRAWDIHDQCWLNSFAIFYNGEFADMAKGVMHGDICQCDINYQKTPPHIIIEQFTGLYDKNGKEIYEGDVDEVGWIVTYVDDGKDGSTMGMECGWYVQRDNFESYRQLVCHDEEFEVIGNIHEVVRE